jgi:BolA protein
MTLSEIGDGAGDLTIRERIIASLSAAFAPLALEVADDSDRHAGHAGAREGGQTHYSVYIVSEGFVGKSRVARHRLVYASLKAEFADGVHALALTTLAPGER